MADRKLLKAISNTCKMIIMSTILNSISDVQEVNRVIFLVYSSGYNYWVFFSSYIPVKYKMNR